MVELCNYETSYMFYRVKTKRNQRSQRQHGLLTGTEIVDAVKDQFIQDPWIGLTVLCRIRIAAGAQRLGRYEAGRIVVVALQI